MKKSLNLFLPVFIMFLLLFSGCISLSRKEIKISGIVSNNQGEPLQGVIIKAVTPEGSFKAVTDKNGRYNLNLIVSKVNIKKLKIATKKVGKGEETNIDFGGDSTSLEEGGYVVEFHVYYKPFGYFSFVRLVDDNKKVDFELNPLLAEEEETTEIENFEKNADKIEIDVNFPKTQNDFNLGSDAPNTTSTAALVKPGEYPNNVLFSLSDKDVIKVSFNPGDVVKVRVKNLDPRFKAPNVEFYNEKEENIYPLPKMIKKSELEFYFTSDTSQNEKLLYITFKGIRCQYSVNIDIIPQHDFGKKGDAPNNPIQAEADGFIVNSQMDSTSTIGDHDKKDCFMFDFSDDIYNITIKPFNNTLISTNVYNSKAKELYIHSCLRKTTHVGEPINLFLGKMKGYICINNEGIKGNTGLGGYKLIVKKVQQNDFNLNSDAPTITLDNSDSLPIIGEGIYQGVLYPYGDKKDCFRFDIRNTNIEELRFSINSGYLLGDCSPLCTYDIGIVIYNPRDLSFAKKELHWFEDETFYDIEGEKMPILFVPISKYKELNPYDYIYGCVVLSTSSSDPIWTKTYGMDMIDCIGRDLDVLRIPYTLQIKRTK